MSDLSCPPNGVEGNQTAFCYVYSDPYLGAVPVLLPSVSTVNGPPFSYRNIKYQYIFATVSRKIWTLSNGYQEERINIDSYALDWPGTVQKNANTSTTPPYSGAP